jgi:hypothetical protein
MLQLLAENNLFNRRQSVLRSSLLDMRIHLLCCVSTVVIITKLLAQSDFVGASAVHFRRKSMYIAILNHWFPQACSWNVLHMDMYMNIDMHGHYSRVDFCNHPSAQIDTTCQSRPAL